MTVFISYQHNDRDAARQINNSLNTLGVETFLDELDPELSGKTVDVTRILMTRLASCQYLLALVSKTTATSWWVPFEIGVATHGQSRIATYGLNIAAIRDLPDYLRTWPILTTSDHLRIYARLYSQDTVILKAQKRFNESQNTPIQSSNDFHVVLKGQLGQ